MYAATAAASVTRTSPLPHHTLSLPHSLPLHVISHLYSHFSLPVVHYARLTVRHPTWFCDTQSIHLYVRYDTGIQMEFFVSL